MNGDPFETLKNSEKNYHKAEITCTKNFCSRARLESTYFCLADLKKSSKSEAEETTLVWQLVKASL